MTLYDYWLALYRRKMTVLLVALSAAGFALLASLLLPPVYEAKASFYVPTLAEVSTVRGPGSALPSAARLLPHAEEKAAGVHVGILRSRDIARAVAEQLPGTSVNSLRRSVDFVIGREFLIEIHARDRDPARAAQIANAYGMAYEAFHSRSMAERSTHQTQRLRAELAVLDEQLLASRQALRQHQENADLLSASLDREKLSQLTKSIESEIGLSEANLAAARERIRKSEDMLRREKRAFRSDEVGLANGHVDALKQTISSLELRLSNIEASLAKNHPRVKQTQEELEQARRELAAEMKNVMASRTQKPGTTYESLRAQLIEQQHGEQALDARVKALRANLEQARATSRNSASRLDVLESLQQQAQSLQDFKLAAQRNLQDALVNEKLPPRTIVLAERATAPDLPAFPRTLLNVLVSLITGVAAGCYYALFLDYLQRMRRERIRRRMDVAPLEEVLQ